MSVDVVVACHKFFNTPHSAIYLARFYSKSKGMFTEALNAIKVANDLADAEKSDNYLSLKSNITTTEATIYFHQMLKDIDSNKRNRGAIADSVTNLHKKACHLFKEARDPYKGNPTNKHSYMTEVTTRLKLLQFFRDFKSGQHKSNDRMEDWIKYLYSSQVEPELVGSRETCTELLSHVQALIDQNSSSLNAKKYEAYLRVQMLDIFGGDRRKAIAQLEAELKINHPSHYRVSLHRNIIDLKLDSNKEVEPETVKILLEYLEYNIKNEKYRDIDMKKWVKLIRLVPEQYKLPYVIKQVENWANADVVFRGYYNNPIHSHFYRFVFYFLLAYEMSEHLHSDEDRINFDRAKENFIVCMKKSDKVYQHANFQDHARFHIQEWIKVGESGVACLESGQQVKEKMKEFKGKVNKTKENRSRGGEVICNNIPIHVDSKELDKALEDIVYFYVGFSYTSARAFDLKTLAQKKEQETNRKFLMNNL